MAIKNIFQVYFDRWLRRSIPSQATQVLKRKNIFIAPSRAGLGFLLIIILLWLLGTNYQNNLVIALAFLLLSLLHIGIFYTYANFSGLLLQCKTAQPCFCGDLANVEILLRHHRVDQHYAHHTITLHLPNSPKIHVDIEVGETQIVTLACAVAERGWYRAERLTVSTVYPLGLIRAWSCLDLAIDVLVYPRPLTTTMPITKKIPTTAANKNRQHESLQQTGVADDISHLRDYQQGDPVRHIAWKTYAKGQGLATKAYASVAPVTLQQWFDWDDFSGFNTEERLSRLCACVLQAEEKQLLYGLRLPDKTLPLGQGGLHQQALLRELALYKKPNIQQ